MSLIFGAVSVLGSLTGSSVENEENLRFAADHGVRAMIEPAPLAEASDAFGRMMKGDARFRMVLSIA
jgi:alcohol dehydrogenase, propanol-preferring